MANAIFSYTPGAETVTIDGRVYSIKEGKFSDDRGFTVRPVIYHDETDISWLTSFMVDYREAFRPVSQGLGDARITMETIRAVLEVFYNTHSMRPGYRVDVIVNQDGRLEGPIALGNPERGMAVIFRDHVRHE